MSAIKRVKNSIYGLARSAVAQLIAFKPSFFLRHTLLHYISGNGIEIGALDRPLDLSGIPGIKIKYIDRLPEDKLRMCYPEVGNKLVHVDIVDDGEFLTKIENETLDFIIANHFIEHARDPMGTIFNWLSKLRPGGIIYMAIPDKRYTFDVDRQITSLQHLIEDHRLISNPQERLGLDRDHYVEWVTYVQKSLAIEIETRANYLLEIDYPIHFHVFTLRNFLEMIIYMRRELKAPVEIKASVDVIHRSTEFFVILSRT